MSIAIVRYNAGNIQSLLFALERLNIKPLLTDNPTELHNADKVIFPGVGEARSAMKYLKQRGLDEVIQNLQQPVLGICVGMQLLCSYSEENDTECIGVFSARVRKFSPVLAEKQHFSQYLKVPQIGWNDIQYSPAHPLFQGLPHPSFVYYVHSYAAGIIPETIASTHYIVPFSAALHYNNFYAVQFHPEKSSTIGEKILSNFLRL